tara:strand:- start:41556 stop:41963 length:408 start_codon:yes stop_codon:yes gene_type:complete
MSRQETNGIIYTVTLTGNNTTMFRDSETNNQIDLYVNGRTIEARAQQSNDLVLAIDCNENRDYQVETYRKFELNPLMKEELEKGPNIFCTISLIKSIIDGDGDTDDIDHKNITRAIESILKSECNKNDPMKRPRM